MTEETKPKNLNLANILSMSRIGAVPIVVALLLVDNKVLSLIAFAVFLIAVLTDILDGYLARRNKQVTNFGRLLDPLADKLINSAALIMLIPLDRVPAWIVVLIIARDTAITSLRAVASAEGIVISANVLGKLKTIAQNIAICMLIVHYPIFGVDWHTIGTVVLWVALAITYWSGIDYFMKFYKVFVITDSKT